MLTPLATLLAPLLALAGDGILDAHKPSKSCQSATAVFQSAKVCVDNSIVERAGKSCVALLEALVARQKRATARTLLEKNEVSLSKSQNRQAQDFLSANADYVTADADLKFLLSETEAALKAVDTYRDSVVFPVDALYAGSAAKKERTIWKQPCYADAATALLRLSQKVLKIKLELKAADLEASRLHGVSHNRGQSLAATTTVVTRGKREVASVYAKRQQPRKQSTITGDTHLVLLPDFSH